jgi:branched-chain amino acid aminotransferase
MPDSIRVEPLVESAVIDLPENLGFGQVFTDRMYTQKYTEECGWHDATIAAYRPITLDPAATVYHNGQMIFDGTKAYRRDDRNINLFRTELNVERFNLSAQRMGMPTVNAARHLAAIEQLVRLEHRWVPDRPGTALYIRPVMIATEKTLEVRASREYLHYIILTPVAPYFAAGFSPVSVYVSDDFVRSVRGGTGEAKTPGNYAGSIAATEIALSKGYQQVLWLDGVERKYVDEVGAMNIAFVVNGSEIVTPTLTGAILQGVTRRSLLTLAPDLGYRVVERRITIDEVIDGLADGTITEVFGMGTGAVIAPVGRIYYGDGEILIRDGQPGPVASRLYDELSALQYGLKPDPYGWIHTIDVPAQVQSAV